MRTLILFIFVAVSNYACAQFSFTVTVQDSLTKEPLYGATVFLNEEGIGALTDFQGNAILSGLKSPVHTVQCKLSGYISKETRVEIREGVPGVFTILLNAAALDLEEIYIEATRANRIVANLPTRTEVLTEEIDEAASMEPSKISHLITHSTGIQVQTTSAGSNGSVVRIQGLNGRYTQLLKDGFPLYGGFSGSLDVMQIPPLDLRQVEYIKGSASTLYGGGAIGGLINLISKKPQKEETLLHVNVSHIGAKDFNLFSSKLFGKFGMTTLASMHLHKRYDADEDGYSDLPEVSKFNFNPKLFWYPNKTNELYLGAMITREERMGGDTRLIDGYDTDIHHFYYDNQNSTRYTSQFQYKHTFSKTAFFTLKNSVSAFNRSMRIRQNVSGNLARFTGKQFNTFSEANFSTTKDKYVLNIGANIYSDRFTEKSLDTNQLRNQEYFTLGVYLNHLWDISDNIALESGLRTDRAAGSTLVGKNSGEFFVLPRISALFKASKSVSFRLGGGMGYRMPTIFNEESEPYAYASIKAIDLSTVLAERSYGGNFDVKFSSNFGTEDMLLSLNQLFFYNLITDPILLNADTTGSLFYTNSGELMHSRGFESQIKLTLWKFTWFFGYTYTDAFIESGSSLQGLLLNPKHSIKGDLLFVEDGKWRIGWDYEYKSGQLLSSGLRSPSLFTTGVIVERTFGNFVIFLNAENFTDTRQTRYASLLSGTAQTPQFTDVWAPLDGFFFNSGLKLKL
ncbi:MAG: TonB-dependent receptor plug domain-containing protein [Flavobacteriales bacterium]